VVARMREQVGRFLAEEADSETALRPREDLLERAFGIEDAEGAADGLDLGEFTLRGIIDRIDVAPDGSGAVVRDYKTGRQVASADKFDERGSLQIQLYMLVARDILGLDVIGGLYQPLGAVKPGERKPRGLVVKGDERLAGLNLVRGDRKDEKDFDEALVQARELAVTKGAELRSGAITRAPLGGSCPKYCTYQPICRLERALGLPEEGSNGNDE
jgi:ATP-dependent helicase/DNAse subunit B